MEKTRFITISTSNKCVNVNAKKVLFFESKRNYYMVYLTDNSTYLFRGTISKLESEMSSLGFFRTHSAFLVNLEHINQFADDVYILIGNSKIPVAQKRAKEFKKVYLEFTRRCIGI